MEVPTKSGTEQSSRGSDDPGLYSNSYTSVLEHYKIKSTLQVDHADFIRLLETSKRLETELK
jgi:hypothetical protein